MTEPGPDDPAQQRADRAERRLRELGQRLLEQDSTTGPDLAGVLEAVTAQIRREARAGRDVPLAGSGDPSELLLTEGALRGLLREVADGVEGVITGRCAIRGDLDDVAAPVGAALSLSVAWPAPLHAVAAAVRTAVAAAIAEQTGRAAGPIDIEIIDLHVMETR